MSNNDIAAQKRPKEQIIKWDVPMNEVAPKLSFGAEAGIFTPVDKQVNENYGTGINAGISSSLFFMPQFSIEIKGTYWGKSFESETDLYESKSDLRCWPVLLSGYFHYPFGQEHWSLDIGAGTGITIGKVISETSMMDPYTHEPVTTSDKETKTSWDLHATAGFQYFLNRNLELCLDATYSYRPFNNWDFNMGGFAVMAGIGYNILFGEGSQPDNQNGQGIDYIEIFNQCDCEKHIFKLKDADVDISHCSGGKGKSIKMQLNFTEAIQCARTKNSDVCFDQTSAAMVFKRKMKLIVDDPSGNKIEKEDIVILLPSGTECTEHEIEDGKFTFITSEKCTATLKSANHRITLTAHFIDEPPNVDFKALMELELKINCPPGEPSSYLLKINIDESQTKNAEGRTKNVQGVPTLEHIE